MIIGLLGEKGSGKDTAGAVLAKELNGTCISFAAPIKRFCMKALGLTKEQVFGDQKEKPLSRKQLDFASNWVPRQERIRLRKNERVIASVQLRGEKSPYTSDKAWSYWLAEATGDYPTDQPTTPWYHNTSINNRMGQWWKQHVLREQIITSRLIMQTFGTEFGREVLGAGFWIGVGQYTADQVLLGHKYRDDVGLVKLQQSMGLGADAVIFTDVRFRNEVIAIERAGGRVVRVRREFEGKKDRHTSETEQQSIPDHWCHAVLNNDKSLDSFRAHTVQMAKAFKYDVRLFG